MTPHLGLILDAMKERKVPKKVKTLPLIGWREWVGLPDLGNVMIKAKVDTGARSSSLHAFDVVSFNRDGEDWVRFKIHPRQGLKKGEVEVESRVLEYRNVRSSSGKATLRPVISSRILLLETIWTVEITLANRDEMGFRMLLGREAFRRKFFVDAGSSYHSARPLVKKVKIDTEKQGDEV